MKCNGDCFHCIFDDCVAEPASETRVNSKVNQKKIAEYFNSTSIAKGQVIKKEKQNREVYYDTN